MKRFRAWFQGLKMTGKVTFISALAIVFIGVVGASAQPGSTSNANPSPAPKVQTTEKQKVEAKIETKTETKAEAIPYTSSNVETATLAKGKTQVQTAGVNGVKTTTYTITLTDGIETNRTASEAITAAPVNEVVQIGTYVAPVSKCDPNYSGCVPIASDVDCAGGSGNGPAYVKGPVQVIGIDIYGLDGDHDGWGCE